MSRSTSGFISSDLPKGKKFIKKLLYVQHVNKEKDTASEISERYLEKYLIDDRTDFPDSNFPEYLKPKANLSILKSSMGDRITKVTVYSNPLPIRLQLKDVTIHAFVVFMTKNDLNHKFTWWSIEKNGLHIVLQQSPEKDDVINKLYDTETKTSVERLGPIQKQKSNLADDHVSDLIQIIWYYQKLNEPYHLLYSNCQNFASFVFEKLNHGKKKWSTVTSAAVDRFAREKKKIQPKIKVDAFKYKWILNDGKFDCYTAMMEGRREDLKNLIKNLSIKTINSVDSQGYTLLEWGTVFSSSDWPIDEELKKKGAQIPSDEKLFKQNVFFIALQYLPSNKKSKLFDSIDGIDINGVNPTGDTALHLALYGENWKMAVKFLKKCENFDVNRTNNRGDTPLHLATIFNCEIGLFKKILHRTNSEYVNKVDGNGKTALHYATMYPRSKTEVEELLLKREDVDVDIKKYDDSNAPHLVEFHFMKILHEFLFQNPPDFSFNDIDFPSDFFDLILEKTTDINAHSEDMEGQNNDNETTRLHLACKWKKDMQMDFFSQWPDIQSDLFKLILEKTADVNAQDKDGNTPLHIAIIHESEIATKELLNHKDVNVNIKNNDNHKALSYAQKWENIPSVLFNLISERKANEKISKMNRLSKYNSTVHK